MEKSINTLLRTVEQVINKRKVLTRTARETLAKMGFVDWESRHTRISSRGIKIVTGDDDRIYLIVGRANYVTRKGAKSRTMYRGMGLDITELYRKTYQKRARPRIGNGEERSVIRRGEPHPDFFPAFYHMSKLKTPCGLVPGGGEYQSERFTAVKIGSYACITCEYYRGIAADGEIRLVGCAHPDAGRNGEIYSA